MRNLLSLIVVFFFIISSLLAVYLYRGLKEAQYNLAFDQELHEIINSNRFLEIENSRYPINDQLLISTYEKTNVDLDSLLTSGPRLILRFSELTCSEC